MSSPHATIDWEQQRALPETRGIAVRMNWRDLLFVHWRVDPDQIAAHLPRGMQVDTFDGSAWIGLVPFLMDDVRFFGLPGIPTLRRFHECNIRTYVLVNGVPGVWFFSLDAASRLAVLGGRHLWNLNYIYSGFKVANEAETIDYRVRRTDGLHSHLKWTPGDYLPPSEPGSVRHFLTERYYLFANRRDRVWTGPVWHEPWRLRQARIHAFDDELVDGTGLETSGDPVFMAADPVDVLGWRNQLVQR
jgi:uncharacterized protein YqjF (DUF2071 family)